MCAFPPIRQKKGEWMGHGAFVFGKDKKQVLRLPFAVLRVAQDDSGEGGAPMN
jgi:hypothetical protein